MERSGADVVRQDDATVGAAHLGYVQMVVAVAEAQQHPLGPDQSVSPGPFVDLEHLHLVRADLGLRIVVGDDDRHLPVLKLRNEAPGVVGDPAPCRRQRAHHYEAGVLMRDA